MLLVSAGRGETSSISRLFGVFYADLHEIARARLRRSRGSSLIDATALLHESYLRVIKLQKLSVQDQAHFLAYIGRVMRSVMVDLAREARAECRGGDQLLVTLDTALGERLCAGDDCEILAVRDALAELAAVDPRMVRIVQMRYFEGLEMSEIALALGMGKRTVERDWAAARSLLQLSLRHG